MTEIIERINNLYEVLKAKDNELVKLIQKSKDTLASQEKIQKDQDARETALNDREFKIGKIENIVLYKKEADRLLLEAQKITQGVELERADFLEWTKKERADIDHCKIGIDSSIKAIKEREEKLAEERSKLEEEKKHYKEWLIREMGK